MPRTLSMAFDGGEDRSTIGDDAALEFHELP